MLVVLCWLILFLLSKYIVQSCFLKLNLTVLKNTNNFNQKKKSHINHARKYSKYVNRVLINLIFFNTLEIDSRARPLFSFLIKV